MSEWPCTNTQFPLGHAEPARGLDRHQHRCRALVDLIAGYQQPRIRVADHPVVVGDIDDLIHRPLDRR